MDNVFSSTVPYDIATYYDGAPTASDNIFVFIAQRDINLVQDLPNAQGYAGVAATAITNFDIRRNGVSIGTISWAAAAQVPTFTLAANENFLQGERLEIVAPAIPDSTLADISLSIRAFLGTV